MRLTFFAVVLVSSLSLAAAPKRVSFEFANADVHSVLRLFAEVGHFNLVTSEAVSGKVTVSLRNVPWDQAMRVVLASKGLGLERNDNIVRGTVSVDTRTNTLIIRDVE